MRFWKRLGALLVCGAVLCSGVQTLAAEEILDIEYKKIDQDGFVADVLNGVEAQYNLYGSTLYCSELIERYYKQIYGLDLTLRGSGTIEIKDRSDCWFEKTNTPKTGDVLFGSAAARQKGYNHWAIVKSYDAKNDIVTVFEQNWRWGGKAGVNRQMSWSDSCYDAYTLKWAGDAPAAQIPAVDQMSDWAADVVALASDAGIFACADGFQEPVSAQQFGSMLANLTDAAATVVAEYAVAMGDGETVNWDQARAALQEAYNACGGDSEKLPVLTVSSSADTVKMTAEGIVVPESAEAAGETVTLEQAVALSTWLYENTDLNLGQMHEAMSKMRSGVSGEMAPRTNAVASIVTAAFGDMYLSRTRDYYTGSFVAQES